MNFVPFGAVAYFNLSRSRERERERSENRRNDVNSNLHIRLIHIVQSCSENGDKIDWAITSNPLKIVHKTASHTNRSFLGALSSSEGSIERKIYF